MRIGPAIAIPGKPRSVLAGPASFGGSMVFWFHAANGLVDISGRACTVTPGGTPPLFVASDAGYNGQPSYDFSAGRSFTMAFNDTIVKAYTMFIVGNAQAIAAFRVAAASSVGTTAQMLCFNGSDVAYMDDGVAVQSVANWTSKQSVSSLFNGASSSILVSSLGAALVSGDAGAGAVPTGLSIGQRAGGSLPWGGKITDVIVYNSGLSLSNRATLHRWAAVTYGTPLAA